MTLIESIQSWLLRREQQASQQLTTAQEKTDRHMFDLEEYYPTELSDYELKAYNEGVLYILSELQALLTEPIESDQK